MVEYTQADELLIEEKFNDLLQSCQRICKSEADWEIINKAFFMAKEAHKGIRRRSGEPYILHPIAVSKIVVDEVGLGVKSVVSALLHDVVEDTETSIEEIERLFGHKIATMVDGLTKMAGVFNADTSEQAEYFRKVLLTLSDDVRVILIKIADRLHNMRTLGSMPIDKQIKITSETIYLFAPLAYRLGLYAIKTELEDLSLKYRLPEEYNNIAQKLNATEVARHQFIQRFTSPIIEKLDANGIRYRIEEREKSIYSIWLKMQRKRLPFEEIYDLVAIRIIFTPGEQMPEKLQCWHIFSLITDIYEPKPDRLRDWVTTPKVNGYEALHTTVMGPDGLWAEVQIRSERMDEIAERGFAAHWKYKQAVLSNNEDEFDKWLKMIREALSGPTENAVEFLDNFKMTLYTTEIVAFTPKGESRRLPKGATALDFAYDIHSKIGDSAIGAKINYKLESIFTPISNGDQIQIVTSESARPVVEWLKHVVTAKAKQHINSYLKKSRENNIKHGIELFEAKLREQGVSPSARVFRKVLPAYECSKKEEFYSKVGAGIISLDNIGKILRSNSSNKVIKLWTLQLSNQFRFLGTGKKRRKYVIKGPDELSGGEGSNLQPNFEIATCCNPIPGDEVVGYLEPGQHTIIVHKSTCNVLTKLASQHGENITSVKWSNYKTMSYLSELHVKGIDRVDMLMNIAQIITVEFDVNIRELHILSHDGIFECTISMYVANTEAVNQIISKLQRIKGIETVTRTTSPEV
ncbi:GTP pyrophosphokinase [Bacteroidia bacterium]|nr:GTP pyrophosphokinase [Bacteroidia bacterium]